MAAMVLREEGLVGFFRGLWIPLFTISVVRATSFSIYNNTKEMLVRNGYFTRPRALDVGLRGCVGGATAGAIICFGSARESPVCPSIQPPGPGSAVAARACTPRFLPAYYVDSGVDEAWRPVGCGARTIA